MQLERFQAHGYFGLEDRTWSFATSTGASVATLVVGRGGKTNLLRAIALTKEAIGAYGRPRFTELRGNLQPREGFVEAVWRLSAEERAELNGVPGVSGDLLTTRVTARDEAPSVDVRIANVLSTWTEGGLVFLPGPRAVLTQSAAPITSGDACDGSASKYAGVVARLGELADEDRQTVAELLATTGVVTTADEADQLRPLKRALEGVIAPRFLGMMRDRAVDRALFETVSRRRIGLEELSRQERNAFLVAATLFFARNGRGVVILDDAFDGVDDEGARAWLDWLLRIAGHAQVIAATPRAASRAIDSAWIVEARAS